MAATAATLKDLSTTAASNGPSGSSDPPSTLDDSLRNLASMARYRLGTHGSIASAATCDIGTKEERSLAVSGTTGITSYGTSLGAGGYGIVYELTFDGVLTMTNSSSLACITSADITTAAGDSCALRYGSAGWTMLWFARKDGRQVSGSPSFGDGTVSLPSMSFTADLDNGFYRIGTNNWAASCAGTKILEFASGALTATGSLVVSGAFTAGPSTAFRIDADGSLNFIAPAASGTSQIVSGANLLEIQGHTTGGGRISMADTGVSYYVGASTPAYFIAASGGSYSFARSGTGDGLRWSGTSGQLTVVETIGKPTITSGSGTPAGTIAGTDQAFRVTMGTTPGTTLVIAFSGTWANAPMVHPRLQANIACWVSAVSTTSVTITFASAPSTSAVLDVWCIGYQTS